MLTLLWTILNVILLVCVVFAWFKVLILLRRQLGLGLALLFLMSLSVKSSQEPEGNIPNLLAPANNGQPLGNWSQSTTVTLNPNNKLHLIFEGTRTDSSFVVSGLYPTISGLMLGHTWKPLGGTANVQQHQVAYDVILLHQWKLLGIPLYTSSGEYKNRFPVQTQ
ncbi:hypothetical protein [Hymenobacter rigui]|uniref:Uncharacterized protein n=1 Tax=Hymenobacter rigui TaxID=334424 RepID=A0A428KWG2_9BACT|nr:hypothetical protein [Hymenobacter rigui]RSK51160.1 hypothetical protein EI291_02265 [Hymenobacter rigui]